MTLTIAVVLAFCSGAAMGVLWRSEEFEAMSKEVNTMRDELAEQREFGTYKQQRNWVS